MNDSPQRTILLSAILLGVIALTVWQLIERAANFSAQGEVRPAAPRATSKRRLPPPPPIEAHAEPIEPSSSEVKPAPLPDAPSALNRAPRPLAIPELTPELAPESLPHYVTQTPVISLGPLDLTAKTAESGGQTSPLMLCPLPFLVPTRRRGSLKAMISVRSFPPQK